MQGAHYIWGPFGEDSDLRGWGQKLAERGGKNAKKRAVVAVSAQTRGTAASVVGKWRGLRTTAQQPERDACSGLESLDPRTAELDRRVQVTATKS